MELIFMSSDVFLYNYKRNYVETQDDTSLLSNVVVTFSSSIGDFYSNFYRGRYIFQIRFKFSLESISVFIKKSRIGW
ncbi:unknown protein [Desulfotalea psychrophila LSv54]|uniref:Uncharacterized protein n=1 Tax=Desulfotalea psychrophila (strain LSv54 / DSM 12343) TaxID=177439 RepID=Q6AKT4_DESPS|nr:unknown protein [Desulfotalea psychrophila LSv54]